MSRTTLRATLVGAAATALVAAGFHAVPAVASTTATASVTASVDAQQQDADADGKDLFRGVHFFQGELADTLVDAKIVESPRGGLKTATTPEATAAVDALISAIEAEDPTFFAELSADLRSGDPYRVDEALQRSSEHIAAHGSLIDDDGTNQGACMVLALAAAVVVVGFGWAVYAADVAVALNRYVAVTQPVQELTAEQFVAKLTPALAQS